jgi:hypothetical protein
MRLEEVYNFGLSGSGTDQQLLIYRKFASGGELGHADRNTPRRISAKGAGRT